jgi:hypothetical protein
MKKKNPHTEFKIHAPQFLKELFDLNPKLGGVLFVPANVFRLYLAQIAERASQLNDPKLNAIMVQMSLYEVADPQSPEYDAKVAADLIEKKYSKD